MQIFQPVDTLADFYSLDEGDVLFGYMDGIQGLPCDLKQVSRAYWHGWRNGVVDGGFLEPDEAQSKLDAAFQNLGSS
ncbi:hypothetical protein EBE87_19450 [Pseudoroseomonas wenyumeiae]|uniref:Uncharacterized protein n=1 Tax=Teichococcus wenyumeiae TaxID=2478470 RepID=A0A3A9JFQ2_9PROT|nr:hypothetical protein [Pseudoroseomonas wenyumeiae]RKK05412.1 hypothetical protein D6Z83_04175 [Pseudoroseomonas wenyumeiae]RMI19651.1 hypothetical protein EBE87_19450 [Pseudoroseomonas wenyumeiae]